MLQKQLYWRAQLQNAELHREAALKTQELTVVGCFAPAQAHHRTRESSNTTAVRQVHHSAAA
jgi:hypothetical protein